MLLAIASLLKSKEKQDTFQRLSKVIVLATNVQTLALIWYVLV